MKTMNLGRTNLRVPVIGLGCMRITELGNHQNVRKLIDTAMDQGINFFDHADIYARWRSGAYFWRGYGYITERKNDYSDEMCNSSRSGSDFSKDHILQSVDESLKRLNTEYLDILLLHRPDTLMEPEDERKHLIFWKHQEKFVILE